MPFADPEKAKSWRRARRAVWRASGLCAVCGSAALSGLSICKRCSEYHKAWAKKQLSEGLCQCGNPPVEGRKRCASCTRQTRVKYRRLRARMFEVYGTTCAHCGFADTDCLQLDHIANNGSDSRRENGRVGGVMYYAALQRQGWPRDGYQVLCANCNIKKEVQHRAAVLLEVSS